MLQPGMAVVEAQKRRDEEMRDTLLAERVRDARQPQQRFILGSKCEETLGAHVKERTRAHVVAHAEQPVSPGVPDDECEITQQALRALLPPRGVAMQDEL